MNFKDDKSDCFIDTVTWNTDWFLALYQREIWILTNNLQSRFPIQYFANSITRVHCVCSLLFHFP